MKTITADYIFPVSCSPLKNGIITFDEHGKILSVEPAKKENLSAAQYYKGILVPGFVNAHTHLELAHCKGIFKKGLGLGEFIVQLQQRRHELPDRLEWIKYADDIMWRNGIVAAGDVSNEPVSFDIKAGSKIKYHTFVELYGLKAEKADEIFSKATELKKLAKEKYGLFASLAPHAPYSLSKELFLKIAHDNKQHNTLTAIHNQESDEENQLFLHKSGQLYDALQQLNIDFSSWKETGKNSLQSVFPYLSSASKILLVHNTYTRLEDMKVVKGSDKLYWVFVPNANLYIEGRLPDIQMFINQKQIMAIGTDSFASNEYLSVLEELKTISLYFPDIPLMDMIKWATLNGAKALNFDKCLGSFDKGKVPGINLISNIDMDNLRLTKESSLKKII